MTNDTTSDTIATTEAATEAATEGDSTPIATAFHATRLKHYGQLLTAYEKRGRLGNGRYDSRLRENTPSFSRTVMEYSLAGWAGFTVGLMIFIPSIIAAVHLDHTHHHTASGFVMLPGVLIPVFLWFWLGDVVWDRYVAPHRQFLDETYCYVYSRRKGAMDEIRAAAERGAPGAQEALTSIEAMSPVLSALVDERNRLWKLSDKHPNAVWTLDYRAKIECMIEQLDVVAISILADATAAASLLFATRADVAAILEPADAGLDQALADLGGVAAQAEVTLTEARASLEAAMAIAAS